MPFIVSTHSRPKAAGCHVRGCFQSDIKFQHTAARRRLVLYSVYQRRPKTGFNTQPPEGGWVFNDPVTGNFYVSTHSRPKAAGSNWANAQTSSKRFNTPPPEGGWRRPYAVRKIKRCFNTQPPEGGWIQAILLRCRRFCFNTQPPEGGWRLILF